MRGIKTRFHGYGQHQEQGVLVNEFGQPILADYGCDDLSPYLFESNPAPVIERTPARKGVRARIVALLDPDAPARLVGAERVSAKSRRTAVTRTPDLLDEVAEEAVWLGDDAVVVVPLSRLDDFRAWVNSRGLAPCGRGAYRLHVLTTEAPASTWDCIEQVVKPLD